MTLQKVDTFAHDITDEIRLKDALISEGSTAVNDIGNTPELKSGISLFTTIISILFLCGFLGAGFVGYTFYTEKMQAEELAASKITSRSIPRSLISLKTLSVTLDSAIGNFVTDIKKSNSGYIITINSYSPVFLYMAKNEDSYIPELAKLFEIKKVVSSKNATSTQVVATSTPSTISTSTTTATSSKNITGSSTVAEPFPINTNFEDVTISNQNMRVWKSATSTVVYAFITTKTIAIASSTDGILELRSDILR
jgi:hypothetical protein